MAVRDDFAAGEVLAAADLNDTFADKATYSFGTAEPSTPDAGDQWFDNNIFVPKVYTGSVWVPSAGRWVTWTPSYDNLTIGNGTVTAFYTQVGRLVVGHFKLVLGSTSAVATSAAFSPPISVSGNQTLHNYGLARYNDTGTTAYAGWVDLASNKFRLMYNAGANNSLGVIGATTPFTWTTGDSIVATFQYQID